jgi:hypothetical protein
LTKIKSIEKNYFFSLLNYHFIDCTVGFGASSKKIIVENSDFVDVNQTEFQIYCLLVRVNHDGVVMTCNKAYYFQKENYIKAFEMFKWFKEILCFLNSKYAE